MEKTIAEIKTIVQQHCESLCPRRGYQSLLPFGTPKGIIHRKMAGDFRIKIGSIDLHLDDLDNNDWIAAYRLLGLEVADGEAKETQEDGKPKQKTYLVQFFDGTGKEKGRAVSVAWSRFEAMIDHKSAFEPFLSWDATDVMDLNIPKGNAK